MRGIENVYIAGSSDKENRLMRPYDECSSDTAAPYSINTPVVLKKWAAAARHTVQKCVVTAKTETLSNGEQTNLDALLTLERKCKEES
ncbi:hypothetical protein TNIN_211761 [Trichonephila inaurata madagascariensis]|uniref:Uncharacterized protein n=1 Tax=Trichonephila inaurata madagascariensis TaxID=2747483 RepID=A0A8X6M510_9ARAC|nr:hypothetical protein TNIN_211761 [Trichonephila inaurata madagascariensis]